MATPKQHECHFATLCNGALGGAVITKTMALRKSKAAQYKCDKEELEDLQRTLGPNLPHPVIGLMMGILIIYPPAS